MLNIVLFEPEIPPNTGNIIRLCANTGCQLHLIKPMGFEFNDKKLRRAGLDYHDWATVKIHENYAECEQTLQSGRRFAVTTKGTVNYSDINYRDSDVLVFGPETRGLPDSMLARFEDSNRLRIPMLPTSRSLNLSNAVATLTYEAWKQLDFIGAKEIAG